MSKILRTKLAKSIQIAAAISLYVNDILVDECKVTAVELVEHLK